MASLLPSPYGPSPNFRLRKYNSQNMLISLRGGEQQQLKFACFYNQKYKDKFKYSYIILLSKKKDKLLSTIHYLNYY